MDPALRDPYGTLGVRFGATQAEVAAAYRKASLRVHPDRCPDDPKAAEKFGCLTRARDILLGQARSCSSTAPAAAAASPNRWRGTGMGAAASSPAASNVGRTVAFYIGSRAFYAEEASVRMPPSGPVLSGGCQPASTVATPQPPGPPSPATRRDRSACMAKAKVKAKAKAGTGRRRRQESETPKKEKEPARRQRREAVPKVRETKVGTSSVRREPTQSSGGVRREAPEDRQLKRLRRPHQQEQTLEQKQDETDEGELDEQDTESDVEATPEAEALGEECLGACEEGAAQGEDVAVDEAKEDEEEDEDEEAKARRDRRRIAPENIREEVQNVLEMAPDVPELPSAARRMLSIACNEFEIADFSAAAARPLHPYQARALAMVTEALAMLQRSAASLATSSRAKADAAAADVEGHAQNLARADGNASRELEIQEARARELSKALAAKKAEAAEVRKAERSAQAAAHESSRQASLSKDQHAVAQCAFEDFCALEAAEAPPKAAELKRMLKDVDVQLKAMRLAESLFQRAAQAVMPALRRPAAQRTAHEEAALAAAEGCFRDHVQGLAEELASIRRDASSASAMAARAKSATEAAVARADEAAGLLRGAKEMMRERTEALQNAKLAVRQHREEVERLAADAVACSATLTKLDHLLTVLGAPRPEQPACEFEPSPEAPAPPVLE